MTPGQAAYGEAIATGEIPDIPWEYNLPDTRRTAWETIAKVAANAYGALPPHVVTVVEDPAATAACPCGGMPGTSCGDELARRAEQIARLEAEIRELRAKVAPW